MNHSKSSLFLMELIAAILFFSLASAVCIQLFAKSHLIGLETVNQNNAIIQAQNLAESWYAAEGDLSSVNTLLSGSVALSDKDAVALFFDQEWEPMPAERDRTSASYAAELSSAGETEDGLISADISVYEITAPEQPLYSLQLKMHIADRRGSHE